MSFLLWFLISFRLSVLSVLHLLSFVSFDASSEKIPQNLRREIFADKMSPVEKFEFFALLALHRWHRLVFCIFRVQCERTISYDFRTDDRHCGGLVSAFKPLKSKGPISHLAQSS